MKIDLIALKRKEKEFRHLTEAEIKKACGNYRKKETFKDRVFTTLFIEFLQIEEQVVFNEEDLLESYRAIRNMLIEGTPSTFLTTDLQTLPNDQ